MDRDEVRAHLTGPIGSIHTPFTRDGDVDYEGIRREIDAIVAGGGRTVLLTAGDSHYLCLSDEEIGRITQVTCQHTARRAMVVAADRWHSTGRAVAFARFAGEAGADVVMCLPPSWAGSCTPETLADHYAAVAQALPVMIVTGLFLQHSAAFGLETVARALDRSERIVAIKDDVCGDFARRLCLLAHSRCAMFAGGQKVNHLNMWPYGCDGYMSTFLMLNPGITHRYWNAIERSDLESARTVVRDYDMPLFDVLETFTGGWNAALHGALELFGLAGRWRRRPYYTLNDEEMERLAAFFLSKETLKPAPHHG
jgi:dihydrodipicolinate synthase/N-acetylneuraminate lyase